MAEQVDIAGYRIDSVLGYGGMSTVYLAEQQSLGRQVALKVMSDALAGDPTYTKRFLKEARIIAQLVHPHIIVIYDYGVKDGHHYIAMEYVSGGDLFRRIKQTMSVRDVLKVVIQTCQALNYAHGKGYIHRDIKPGNILFRDQGNAVLSDFGLAKGLGDATQMTATGTTMGTPAYMSPEQAFGENVDARSDLYSMGCVFHYMLTGRKPYEAENPVALAMKHLREPVPQLPEPNAWLQPVLDRFMAKGPSDRYQSGQEAVAHIESLLGEDSLTPIKSVSPKTPAEPATNTRQADPGVVEFRIQDEELPSQEEISQVLGAQVLGAARPAEEESPAEPTAAGRLDSLVAPPLERDEPVDPKSLLRANDASDAVQRFRESSRDGLATGAYPAASAGGQAPPAAPAQPRSVPHEPPAAAKSAGQAPRSRTGVWIGAVVASVVLATLANVGFTMYMASRVQLVPQTSEAEEVARYEQKKWTGDASKLVRFADDLKSGGKGPGMVVVPAGQFQMGDLSGRYGPSARPVIAVTVPRSFAISEHEVTFTQYDRFASATGAPLPRDRGWGRQDHPVIYVSWNDAVAYTEWLSQQTGRRYRLPSEAEWEYAARGGATTDYWWGDRASHQFANFGSDVCCRGAAEGVDRWADGTAEVGSFAANPFGLYDTSGNVWEWVQDCWNIDHQGAAGNTRPRLAGDCAKRVVRGGSWSDIPLHVASPARGRAPADSRHAFVGFRVVREE